MQTIGSFLERFKNFTPPPLAAARAVCVAVKQTLGVDIRETQVRMAQGIAYITASGIIKSEIILNKKNILQNIQSSIADGVRDIR